MRRYLFLCSIISLSQFGCLAGSLSLAHAGTTPEQAQEGLDFLVQKVCVTAGNQVLNIDPYDCPSGDRLRNLAPGEPLPYHRHDQPDADHPDGFQRHDAYPLRDRSGQVVVLNPFDHQPFGHFEPAHDGYDAYTIRDGWASGMETRDAVGFSTTFFSAGCKPYSGWVFFNLGSLQDGKATEGRAYAPISGNYWEHNGQDWPGTCPEHYDDRSLTTWEWIKAFPYGGVNGSRIKTLDTIRSIHGFVDAATFREHGHLEVFYFTRLYGLTRWEAWVPDKQLNASSKVLSTQLQRSARNCQGATHLHYQGLDFTRSGCRDWSSITPVNTPELPPAWPLPDLNLLRNFHFGADLAGWTLAGAEGQPLNAQLRNSQTAIDLHFVQRDGKGLRYLALSCGDHCKDGASLYQDVPLSPEISSGDYSFGITARTERDRGAVRITLEQLDAKGTVLDSHAFEDSVLPRNDRFSGEESILKSSSFIVRTEPVTINPRTQRLRLRIAPLTPDTYDLSDAWLMKRSN